MTSTTVAETAATSPPAPPSRRLPLIDALRALACTIIAWHHFIHYWPLQPDNKSFLSIEPFYWLWEYGRPTPIFFVIGGFVTTLSTAKIEWSLPQAGRFALGRYCRLGLPYLACILLAIAASNFARGTLDEHAAGKPVTLGQFVAHVFFLQDILADFYPDEQFASLSAGLWYVCVDFQLILMYAALMVIGAALSSRKAADEQPARFDVMIKLGWPLALFSLLYCNFLGWPPRAKAPDMPEDNWVIWGTYFFHYFFMGYLVRRALLEPKYFSHMVVFGGLILATSFIESWLFEEWGWRLGMGLATAIVLYWGGKTGMMARWPESRVVAWLGRTSYSFFLVHFPVMLVMATLWIRAGWTSNQAAWTGMAVTYVLSLVVTAGFYRACELPAARLGRLVSKA